jgi:predicted DNA binding CopG/RHH family protein
VGRRAGAGRPRGSENDGRIDVRAPAELVERVHKRAASDGIDYSEWVRQALVEKLGRGKKVDG